MRAPIKQIPMVGINGNVYYVFDPEDLKRSQAEYVAEVMARPKSEPKPYVDPNEPGSYLFEGWYSNDPECVSG